MSGTFPSTPSFESINFQINTPTLVTETVSGKRQRVGMGHQFYSFTVKYPRVTQFQIGPALAFVSAQYGPLESFQIVLPELSYSKNPNIVSNTVTTTASASIGNNTVTVAGGLSTGTFLAAGDFFKFANHTKVYMCTADYILGEPLYFAGSLVEAVPAGTQIIYQDVPFTVMMDNEIQQYSTGLGGITTLSIDMREVW